jgi:3-hydroxy-9,10-secoandrosta-1,3,5(10)-triene-9,17-dione monooxygenase reductase component
MRGFDAIDPPHPAGRDRDGRRELKTDAGADLETIASYDVHAIALDTAATWSAPASELVCAEMEATPAVDPARYREVIGSFATGVAIVTAHGDDGSAGLTTNAVTSLSLDPLLLLVCFDNASRTLPVVRQSRRFAVNILRAGQEDLARIFASKRVAEEKFDAVTHTVAHGVPVIDDALAWIACDLQSLQEAGDHTIGIGRVTHLSGDDAGDDPLVFFRGRFRRLA